jgi:amidase
MAKTVTDAAIILSFIAGRDSKDNFTQSAPENTPDYTQFLNASAIQGKRFGVPRAFTDDQSTGNHPQIGIAYEEALRTIRSLGGIIVEPTDLPSGLEIAQSQNESLVLTVDFKVGVW